MRLSTISHEVVSPASVQVNADKSGKVAKIILGAEQRETIGNLPLEAEVKSPVELVINGQGLGLKFFYDREAGIRVIQVVDEESGDIIRQIPPDEVVDFMRQFRETKGHFVSLRF
jgi:flagellar protein FlaG